MLVIVFFWVIVSLIFLAFGRMFAQAANAIIKKKWTFSVFDTFWLGLCSVGALVTILSLFIPIKIYLLIAVLLITTVYWIFNYKFLVSSCKSIWSGFLQLSISFKICLFALLAIFVIYSLYTYPFYDMGLYHLQSMMWAEEYSVVPGLGNLHGRLAFNPNSLLVQTLLSYHPGHYSPYFLLYGLCFFVFSSWVIKHANKLESNISSVALVAFLFVFILFFKGDMSSTSTDVLPAIFILYILFSFILGDVKVEKLFVLSIMVLYCITLKLSTAPIALVVLLGMYHFYKSKNIKAISIIVVLGFVIFVPWLVRYIILSGYLLYPYPDIDIFNFDWKMPIKAVTDEKVATLAWARIQEPDGYKVLAMPFSEWLPEWIKIQSSNRLRMYLLTLISPILMLISGRIYKKKPIYLIAWLIALSGALYGFFTAPDFRFSGGFIIATGFMPLVLLGYRFELKKMGRAVRLFILPCMMAVCIYVVLLKHSKRDFRDNRDPDYPVLSYMLKPQPMDYFKNGFSNSDVLHYELNYTEDNTPVYVVVNGDQCFDKDLLCTCDYYFKPRMVKRGGSLQNGFKIEK